MITQSIKQFLKPNWKKIILFLIFMIIGSFICYHKEPTINCGFPMPYLKVYYLMTLVGEPGPKFTSFFSVLVDLIFWYLIACGIIFAYQKLKKRKKSKPSETTEKLM